MNEKLPTAQTVSTSIRSRRAKVWVRKARGKHCTEVHTVNEAGKRGLHYPPAQ